MIAQFGQIALLIALAGLLGFGVVYTLRSAEGGARFSKDTILVFIAFYSLFLGLRLMVEGSLLLGDLFASLALTFLWSHRK